ncbi:hypothetical protein [Actinomadura sp. HBU206391]|uniref:hypothetical protein n=1 Tax=Actinomadura sp. HBU206391 TaxID=2731692 RepID=UPI001C9C6B57|nr:hypothetical protein [Actinomadura sp. HBU206391]
MRDWLRPVTYARTLFLIGSRDAFAAAATDLEAAAGWGPRQPNIRKGDSTLMSTLTWNLEPDPSIHRPEIDVCGVPAVCSLPVAERACRRSARPR